MKRMKLLFAAPPECGRVLKRIQAQQRNTEAGGRRQAGRVEENSNPKEREEWASPIRGSLGMPEKIPVSAAIAAIEEIDWTTGSFNHGTRKK